MSPWIPSSDRSGPVSRPSSSTALRSSCAVRGVAIAATTSSRRRANEASSSRRPRINHPNRSTGTAVAARTRGAVARGTTNADVRMARIRTASRSASRARISSGVAAALTWIDSGPLGFVLYTPTTDATASSALVADPSSRCRRNEKAVMRWSGLTLRVSGVGRCPSPRPRLTPRVRKAPPLQRTRRIRPGAAARVRAGAVGDSPGEFRGGEGPAPRQPQHRRWMSLYMPVPFGGGTTVLSCVRATLAYVAFRHSPDHPLCNGVAQGARRG